MNQPSDFEMLATAANFIRRDIEKDHTSWDGSPFKWILNLPAGSKGKLGKHLIYSWCGLKGLPVDKSPDSQADMLINHHRVEIKLSTLWEGGTYRFQQIRDQNYEYAVCLGISPNEAHCWVISKDVLRENVIGHQAQHTGRAGTETFWFPVDPHNPPDWLRPCGGTLEEAFTVLAKLSR